MTDDRHRRLLGIKLTALLSDHGVRTDLASALPFALGAGVIVSGTAWLLYDGPAERGLGGALAVALRSGVDRLGLLAEAGTGTLARRAAGFTMPIEVWHVDGRTLLPAIAEPLPDAVVVAAEHEAFRPTIAAAGATPLVEHGVLAGEVGGLEVCRVVDDPHSGVARLEVGIGAHDREAFQLLHGDRPTVDALAEVVATIAPHRRAGAAPHALARVGAERALRQRLIDEPGLIGAVNVTAVEPPVPRPNLKDPMPCVAVATVGPAPATVVCSTGVDLDVVPYAVDAMARYPAEQCLVVLPERDALPIQELIAATARPAIRIVGVAP